ncbi:MAG: hypothetical protein KDB90_06460 [Planctomycetes bacterium]|nr:hypothetical protein [Planctomycetota bacterium]
MNGITTWWKGLALWLRWAIVGTPAFLALALHRQLGDHVAWLAVPAGILVIVHVFMTWDDIGDVLRARIHKYF